MAKKTKSPPRDYTCSHCAKLKTSSGQPRGWKLLANGKMLCCICLDKNCVVRVISLPVEEILSENGESLKPWDAFRPAWELSTSMTNWCQIELLKHDCFRSPGDEKMPSFNRKLFPGNRDLYQHWNATCNFRNAFKGATTSGNQIIRSVESRWKSHPTFGRYAVLWSRKSASPTARYPQPWPVDTQSYTLDMIDGTPTITLNIPGGKLTVRLQNDSGWRRDVRRFQEIIDGNATPGTLKVCAKFKDGKLVGAMIRMSATFPRCQQVVEKEKIAYVSTTPENLLVVTIPSQEPFLFCGDDLVGKQAAYDRWRARAATDLKHEKRWPKKKRRRMVLGNQQVAENAANRVKTGMQQIIASLIGHESKKTGQVVPGYLLRQKVAELHYDDTCKEFIRRFAWHEFRELMRNRCDELGIKFVHLNAASEEDDADETPTPARTT